MPPPGRTALAVLFFASAAAAAQPADSPLLTAEMWNAARPIYAQTLAHPYLKGLADGTLPRESFRFYLIEDAKYLRTFSQALSALASKAPREDWAITLNKHSTEAIEAERQLHQSLLASSSAAAGNSSQQAQPPMAPTNYAYTNHLLATVERGSFAEGLAALLPCYWIYWEVGKELEKRGSKNRDYQRWIDQYASASYGATVKQVLDIMNAEAAALTPAQRRRTLDLFVLSARYEYMFWDMAWRREQWPPAAR